MDTTEKIKVFTTFEDLTREITEDKNSHDMRAQRYAVRFIMLDNFNEFKNLALFMSRNDIATLDLEDLIDDEDDTWITKDMLKNAIKSCKESTFVTPFSEVVRFYNDDDFRGFFNEIMLLEDIHNPAKRIYIPLIGLQNRFSDFLNQFARIKESAPVWRYDASPQSVEVFFAKYKDFELPRGTAQCQLNSLREWLMFWKKQAPQERIVCTSLSIAAKYKYSKPDNIFNFTQIANAYEFMTDFLDMSFPFEYVDEEKTYWERFLVELNKNKLRNFSFETYVYGYFNKVRLEASDVINEWLDEKNTAFHRWLLQKYVLHTSFAAENPYVTLCVKDTKNLLGNYDLLNMVTTRILYPDIAYQSRLDYAVERRNVIVSNRRLFEDKLTESDRNSLCDNIKLIYQKQEDKKTAFALCTGVFDFEKILLMGWTKSNPNNVALRDMVHELYPEFEAYQKTSSPMCLKTENQWFVDYLKAYKKAKLEDCYTDEIAQFIKTKNESASSFYKWYFEFDKSHAILEEISRSDIYKPDKIYWIDGLGAEFLSYILYLVEHENTNMKVVRTQFTSSALPSSTYHNRFEYENVKKFGELDALGHDVHHYKYLHTLKDELSVIKNIIREILTECSQKKCTVAIVSDHGLSCLSRKAPSKKYEGKFEHEGRYITTTDDAVSDPDYLVCKNEQDGKNYKVALTHSSLSKAPTHQVHGGCTPEEVLVPFILLSNKDVASRVRYQIKYAGEDIMLSNPVVKIMVMPQPESVIMTCEGKTYDMVMEGMNWTAQLEGITEGHHKIDVKPAGAESTEIDIQIIGISGNTNIVDLFDL